VGRTDVAYRLLQNEDYPSWGYEIGKGATTIWERWNSIMPDGSFGPVEMNSFNHYAYGAVGEWMYRTLAGVSALEPGYAKVLIAPQPGDGITSARYRHETRYGTVRTAWEQTPDGLTLDVTVPANATAELRMPAPSRWAVTEDGQPAELSRAVRFLRMEEGKAVYELGSGDYSFAIDRVLGHLGDAGEAARDLPHSDRRDLLERILRAGSWRLRGDDGRAVSEVHDALELAARRELDEVARHLSLASAELLEVEASVVVPEGEHVPGDVLRVRVVLANGGERRLDGVRSSLSAPAGWTVTPAGGQATMVAPGGTVTHEYDVRIPADAEPGAAELTGTLGYRYRRGPATLPLHGNVDVLPAVALASVEADPAEAGPGEPATIRTVLRNRTDLVRSGAITLELPAGWAAPEPTPYELPPGGELTVESPITVPLSVTEGAATIAATTGGERAATELDVVISNPPAGALDHVDLGNGASESAHGLTASPASGTNVEAGLTRRYTNAAQPGGWFEHDLRVSAGEPFVVRAIETYNGPQLKTYDVLIDGKKVLERAHRRTASGHGSLSFQFVVDEPELTQDGVVRVRFQDTGADHDPSIADVWSVPEG
jgi:hypothetical protein